MFAAVVVCPRGSSSEQDDCLAAPQGHVLLAIPEFIDRIAEAAEEPMRRDLAVLLERYRATCPTGPTEGADRRGGLRYYEEVVRREQLEVDSQQVRTYFDFAKVRQGLLDVTGRLFGLRYEPVTDAAVWHEDVTVYDVYDVRDVDADAAAGEQPRPDLPRPAPAPGQVQARRAVHPRRRGGRPAAARGRAGLQLLARADGARPRRHALPRVRPPACTTCSAGHGEWARFAGVATEWDFVEAPSQMLEEWAWDAGVLRTFATDAAGEPIPADLVERMRSGDDFGKGYHARTQMFYAAVSYWFHQRPADDLTASG